MKYFKDIAKQEKLMFLFIFLFFILFPTNNSTLDAYHYAANVKFNENLFSPHHLLYNVLISWMYKPLNFLNLDVLWFSKFINALFSVLSLCVFYKILSLAKITQKERVLYVLIVAFSFSFWRFGTENETYILPIFFSLLASYYFLKYLYKQSSLFILLSGLSAVIACLFHQIHFFWWLGLLVGLLFYFRNPKTLIIYCISALIVPIAYIFVLVHIEEQELSINNLSGFLFHDFYSGTAAIGLGWQNFFFIFASSLRTFFQVHPNIYILIKKSFLFAIPLLFMLFLSYVLLKSLVKKRLLSKRNITSLAFINTHIGIFLMHFLFAFFATGNIEFMVILPFLLFLSFLLKYKPDPKILSILVVTLFVWNLTYGILPNNRYTYYNDQVLLNFIIEHPDDIFIVKNKNLLTKYYYKTGIDNFENIILSNKALSKEALENILSKKGHLYTDIIDKPEILNREKIISSNSSKLIFDGYKKEKVLQYAGLYGTSTIYKIKPK